MENNFPHKGDKDKDKDKDNNNTKDNLNPLVRQLDRCYFHNSRRFPL